MLLHVPLQVIGQHAEKDMTADTFIILVINRTNLQLHGLQIAKGALHKGQALIGVYDFHGIHLVLLYVRP